MLEYRMVGKLVAVFSWILCCHYIWAAPTTEASLECSDDQFRCRDGLMCIPLRWKCDGLAECQDDSDEDPALCEGQVTCASNSFQCGDLGPCIPASWRCDGGLDCTNGEDEEGCGTDVRTCPTGLFQCSDGSCIPHTWLCDGEADCTNQADEENCGNSTVRPDTVGPDTVGPDTPCAEGDMRGCSQLCLLTAEGYRCDCLAGYRLDTEDQHTCLDIDECQTQDVCSQICQNTDGGYTCSCEDGFILDTQDNSTCQSVWDRCRKPGVCSQYCHNTAEGSLCSCMEGYSVDPENPRSCRADGERPSLLYATTSTIKKIGIEEQNFFGPTILLDDIYPIALDYDTEQNLLFWSEVSTERILFASLNESSPEPIVLMSDQVDTPDGMVWDWVHGNLYWTDTGRDVIGVINLDNRYRHDVITSGLDEPRAIVVDPRPGQNWMYWTDWGQAAKIEKSGLDGSDRQAIVTTEMIWPNGLTIDFTLNRLYWVDAKLMRIYSCSLVGYQRVQLPVGDAHEGALTGAYGITVFEDWLFWTSWNTDDVHKANKFSGQNVSTVAHSTSNPFGIVHTHPTRQPPGINHCGTNNGGCTHLCLGAPRVATSGGYRCACPAGWDLQSDRHTCYNPEPSFKSQATSAVSSAGEVTKASSYQQDRR